MYSPRRLADTFALDRLNALYRAPINKKSEANAKLRPAEIRHQEICDSLIQNIKKAYPKTLVEAQNPNDTQNEFQSNNIFTSKLADKYIEKIGQENLQTDFKSNEITEEKNKNFTKSASKLHTNYIQKVNILKQKVSEKFQNMKNEIAEDVEKEEKNYDEDINSKLENLSCEIKSKRILNSNEKVLRQKSFVSEIRGKENFIRNKSYSTSLEHKVGENLRKNYTKPILQSELKTNQKYSSLIIPSLSKDSILKPSILIRDAKNKDIRRIPIQSIESTKYSTYYR
ncbi:unnamed protein product [Blepharisma stoltei]|uniref:Uncharacterized protein n=1 Tax=Blepharisma stoltei TaxID=1481888 RepID=A0AAU9K1C2_9CILI|nr:unnamed protein product [Blepharisma stoltei]